MTTATADPFTLHYYRCKVKFLDKTLEVVVKSTEYDIKREAKTVVAAEFGSNAIGSYHAVKLLEVKKTNARILKRATDMRLSKGWAWFL